MRLRFDKNAKTFLSNNPHYFVDTTNLTKIDPLSLFNNQNIKVHLEIGSGKGNFIVQHALNDPYTNFIALEKYDTVLVKAIKKAKQYNLNNLKFLSYDANNINELFKDHSINCLYLNFSDPWPKAKHAKRRLTHPNFLSKYKLLLEPTSHIEFKTDNNSLYEYTYNEVLLANPLLYHVIYHTNDLYAHLDEFNNKQNIPSEYETKFHNLQKNIYKIVFNYNY